MSESKPKIHIDFNNPKAPPTILGLAFLVWKLVAELANVDFILSVREEKFGMMFQFLLNYGWWILIAIGVVWALQAHKAPPDPYRVHWGMVIAVGIAAFAFGILIAVYSTGSLPTIVAAYGNDGHNCTAGLDTSKLTNFRDKYHIVLVCGVTDPSIDKYEDTRIAISSPFNISPAGVSVIAHYGHMIEAIQASQQASQQAGTPPNQAMVSIWHTPILMPKDADLSEIKRLSDVPKQGGKILEPGYF